MDEEEILLLRIIFGGCYQVGAQSGLASQRTDLPRNLIDAEEKRYIAVIIRNIGAIDLRAGEVITECRPLKDTGRKRIEGCMELPGAARTRTLGEGGRREGGHCQDNRKDFFQHQSVMEMVVVVIRINYLRPQFPRSGSGRTRGRHARGGKWRF